MELEKLLMLALLCLTVEQAGRYVATFFSKNGGSCSLDKKFWECEFIQFVFSVCVVGGGGALGSLQGWGCPVDTKKQSADLALSLVAAVLVQTHNPLSEILKTEGQNLETNFVGKPDPN